jgi:hypothetical protein
VNYWESSLTNSVNPVGVWGWVSAIDSNGRTIWIVDFVIQSDKKLSVFLELERITHELALSTLLGDDSN